MALFSRRCLQRLIDENAVFLSPEQTEEHVRRLNHFREEYLSTEWEIAILNAFSKLGNVKHEPKEYGGSRLLDVVFDSPAIQFGADVATVSDKNLHERNPVDRIWLEIEKEVRKRGITTGGFDVDIGSKPGALQGRGVRHDLLIPPVAKLKEIVFNAEFKRFMHEVATEPQTRRHFYVRNSMADIRIGYDPNSRTWGGSHLAYTNANIVDDNPVFNALKRKAPHPKQSRYPGMRGVIVCDGGCQILGEGGTNWAEYSIGQVVSELARKNSSIGFIATIGLRHDRSDRIGRGHHSPALSVWVSPDRAAEKQPLISVLEKMVSHLPTFETSAGNALSRVMSGQPQLGSHFGGSTVGGDQYIKLSAIGILQLLAGTISYQEFAERHGFNERNSLGNAFANAVRAGRVIRNCKIESGGEEDDDWSSSSIEFRKIPRSLPMNSSSIFWGVLGQVLGCHARNAGSEDEFPTWAPVTAGAETEPYFSRYFIAGWLPVILRFPLHNSFHGYCTNLSRYTRIGSKGAFGSDVKD
jgi:hypothetical protein